jgi:hypothetical protein
MICDLFRIASALLLLLGIAAVVVWVQSYSTKEFAAKYALDSTLTWTVYEASIRRGDVTLIRDQVKSADAKGWRQVLRTRFRQSPDNRSGIVAGKLPLESVPLASLAEFVFEVRPKPASRINRLGFGVSTTQLANYRTSILEKRSGKISHHLMQLHAVRTDELHVPAWFVVVVFIALSGCCLGFPSLAHAARRLSRPRHRCGHCSYDLTGNTSGVCPECGTEGARQVEAKA